MNYLVVALVVALGRSIEPLHVVVSQFVARRISPIDNSDLDSLRLMHFLAIAVLVARFVPTNWRGLSTLAGERSAVATTRSRGERTCWRSPFS